MIPASTPSSVTAPLRAVIIDDEPTARRGVKLLLAKEPDIELVGEAANGRAGLELLRKERPAIVFLDVQMPELDGFGMLRDLEPELRPAIVFITAYNEHALRAFEVNAVDYLLKPYDDDRFRAALDRARRQCRQQAQGDFNARLDQVLKYLEQGAPTGGAAGEGNGFSDRILIKSSGEVLFLKPEEIDWIEAEGDYMKFHVGGKSHLMRETMARLEARLDPARFIRIHRSTIVNLERVRKLTPSFVGEYAVVLADGTKLKLSRGYQDRLQSQLKSSL